jgi:prepilin-type N-terminal cleavage/methylation domain-containing protein
MKQRFKKGFTLIELMIVIAIVGIITSIAVPMIFGVRTKDNKTSFEQAVLMEKDKTIMDLENALEACENGR